MMEQHCTDNCPFIKIYGVQMNHLLEGGCIYSNIPIWSLWSDRWRSLPEAATHLIVNHMYLLQSPQWKPVFIYKMYNQCMWMLFHIDLDQQKGYGNMERSSAPGAPVLENAHIWFSFRWVLVVPLTHLPRASSFFLENLKVTLCSPWTSRSAPEKRLIIFN